MKKWNLTNESTLFRLYSVQEGNRDLRFGNYFELLIFPLLCYFFFFLFPLFIAHVLTFILFPAAAENRSNSDKSKLIATVQFSF